MPSTPILLLEANQYKLTVTGYEGDAGMRKRKFFLKVDNQCVYFIFTASTSVLCLVLMDDHNKCTSHFDLILSVTRHPMVRLHM